MDSEVLLSIFCDETVYRLVRADEHTAHVFGGPLECRIIGLPDDPRPLHHVASLQLGLLLDRGPHPGTKPWITLPLIYGFVYSGCEIQYRVKKTGWLEILELDPQESSADFPYANYPALLPYAPLKVAETRRIAYEEFADEIPNMTAERSSDLIVAVPPPATLGVSMWGSLGDGDCVTVVFECNLADRLIRAYNRCT